jgi:anti-sigma regulatory factor (Ser/Thr protein kinase)
VPASNTDDVDAPATVPGVALLDERLAAFGTVCAVPDRLIFRARVCVAELAANAIEHAAARPDHDRLMVAMTWRDEVLSVVYRDTTPAFDPTAALVPAAPNGLGGRGLRLVTSLPSSIGYERGDGANVVRMTFAPRSGD